MLVYEWLMCNFTAICKNDSVHNVGTLEHHLQYTYIHKQTPRTKERTQKEKKIKKNEIRTTTPSLNYTFTHLHLHSSTPSLIYTSTQLHLHSNN